MVRKQEIEWHYGEKPPSQTQDYLVTFSYDDPDHGEVQDVTAAWFGSVYGAWTDSADDTEVPNVYAWAEFPDAPPLLGQEENDGKETEHARAGV